MPATTNSHAREMRARAGNRRAPAAGARRSQLGRRPVRPFAPRGVGTPRGSGKSFSDASSYAARIVRYPAMAQSHLVVLPPNSQRPSMISSSGSSSAWRRTSSGKRRWQGRPIVSSWRELAQPRQVAGVVFHPPSRKFMPEKGCAACPSFKRLPPQHRGDRIEAHRSQYGFGAR